MFLENNYFVVMVAHVENEQNAKQDTLIEMFIESSYSCSDAIGKCKH